MHPIGPTYIVCATPRCGSHLLADALRVSGLAGNPDEYFHTNEHGQLQNEQGHIADLYGKKSLEAFHELVLSLGSTPNGVFGIILHWDYLHHIFANFRTLPQYKNLSDRGLLDALFFNPKFILIKRRDKVRQAISWIKAEHTGVWRQEKDSPQTEVRKPLPYDFFLIEETVERFKNADRAWNEFFTAQQIDPFVVVYEDLADSFEETSFALLDFLDIPRPLHIDFTKRVFQKQADAANEAMAKKYIWHKKSFVHRILRYLPYLRMKLLPF